MGNVQAGGHAPQETHPPPPPLIIEGMKIEYSPAALQTRAVSVLRYFHHYNTAAKT